MVYIDIKMVKKDTEIISNKLDAILAILMDQTKIQEETSKEKIHRLIKLGFDDNNEVANIVGTTAGVIAKERYLLKKGKTND